MRYYYLCALFAALLAAGCSSTPPKNKTCGVDKTLLDGTCVSQEVADVGTVTDTDFQVIRSSNELDFVGNIVYAINFNGRGIQKIGDSVFQNVLSSGNAAPLGVNVYGFNVDTLWAGGSNLRINDDGPLENILRSIIWSRGINQGGIELSVEPNNTYRLQLLFSEGCCNNRNFNVTVNGGRETKARGIDVGGSVWRSSTDRGYAFVQNIFAESENIKIDFTRNMSGDTNYHISALTLEKID